MTWQAEKITKKIIERMKGSDFVRLYDALKNEGIISPKKERERIAKEIMERVNKEKPDTYQPVLLLCEDGTEHELWISLAWIDMTAIV